MPILASRAAKRVIRIILILGVVLVVGFFATMWFLNHWLQSPEVHARVERELSLALKLPLKVRSLRLSAFGNLTAEGVTVPDRGRNYLEVASCEAKQDLPALLHGRIVLREIEVESPQFYVRQRQDGSWKPPELPPELLAELEARKKPGKAKNEHPEASAPKPKKDNLVTIGHIRIKNGSAEWENQDGSKYLTALGVAAMISDAREGSLAGYVAVERLVWHGNFATAKASAVVSYSNKGIVIEKLAAQVGGGKVSGGFSTKGEAHGPPFALKLAVDGVDMARAAMDADAPPPNLDGRLSGTLELKGEGDVRKFWTGKGHVALQHATCREIDWVNQLGQVIELEDVDLTAFRIETATADFQIGMDKVIIDALNISAPPLAMTATGTSRLDGTKLNLKANLLAGSEFLKKRPNVEPQFGPPDKNQMRAVAFNLTGALGKPKQNLLERLTGTTERTDQRIKIGLDALNALKKEEGDNAGKDGPAPAPGDAVPAGSKKP